jgi:hypothetical protein
LNGVFTDCLSYGIPRRPEMYGAKAFNENASLTNLQKIRPFFPPLMPLQSLNLRAALYRALTDLKKNGVLGKELLLRKTMLDECKGEKFEEVISSFAMTVLRKVAQARTGAPLQLACSDGLTGWQEAQLLPLIIAHRYSLQQQVAQHRNIKGRAKVYSELLAQRCASIRDRRAQLCKTPPSEADQEAVTCEDIADLWVGDDKWVELLHFGPKPSEDPLLEAPFEIGWEAVLDVSNIDVRHQTDLLKDLNGKVANQETSLRTWRTVAASLRNTQAREHDALLEGASPERRATPLLQFDKHQSLHISNQPLPARSGDQNVRTASIHRSLLASMEADLASLGGGATPKPLMAGEEHGKECRTLLEHWKTGGELPENSYAFPRNASKTSSLLPMRISVSHSNQELSAPRNGLYQHTLAHPKGSTSTTFQQMEGKPPVASILSQEWAPKAPTFYQPIMDDTHYRGTHVAAQPTIPGREQSSRIGVNPSQAHLARNELDKPQTGQSSFTANKDISTPVAARPSERDSEKQLELCAMHHHVLPSNLELESKIEYQHGVQTMVPPPTLLERTRQSMSLLPNPADRARQKLASSKQTRLSQAFPINQFETPSKGKTSEASLLEMIEPRSGSSTPRDELFSDAAAYDSVFKSRPRVALSPALSPDRSDMRTDSMLREDFAELTLQADV